MPRKSSEYRRRICFVTGTRAEFGLMRSVLEAIRAHPRLRLQIVATGMHLDHRRGRTIDRICREGWPVDAIVPWRNASRPVATGQAVAGLAKAFAGLKPDVVLVVGDRVEAFAAAAAAHLSDLPVAHVHGGDRALGQMDDSLRHAITKLSHVHFPATAASAERLRRLGEDRWRIHRTGSPGIDGIRRLAARPEEMIGKIPGLNAGRFALILHHPIDSEDSIEFERAGEILRGIEAIDIDRIVVIYPNNDPGSDGIIRFWRDAADNPRLIVRPDVPRPLFLGLLRDAAMLVGNSSSGIIEAASFHTPVIDVGPRQLGRQRCRDVRHVPCEQAAIAAAARAVWNHGRPRRCKCPNLYGGDSAGDKIAAHLAGIRIDTRLLRKIIAY